MKFFMRTFNGAAGILLAGILLDQGAWWGLEFVRDGIVQGQGAVQADMPLIRRPLAAALQFAGWSARPPRPTRCSVPGSTCTRS